MKKLKKNKIKEEKKLKILFFGRYNCKFTKFILEEFKNYECEITILLSKSRGEKIPGKILKWRGNYILSFRSLYILPKTLIDNAEQMAINFHPGPPEYPGSGCINFALYDEVNEFGVTAHIMNQKIDNGQILEVRKFKVHLRDTLQSLLLRTHEELYKLCIDFIKGIILRGNNFIDEKKVISKKEKWVGEAKILKDLERLQTISPLVTEAELKKIIRATYIDNYPPVIKIHGYTFDLNLSKIKLNNKELS